MIAEELAERWLAESPPKSAEERAALADRCFDVGAYAAAKRHYETSLEGLEDPKRASGVKLRVRHCGILLDAKEAVARKKRIRVMAHRKRFVGALTELASLRADVAEVPAVARLLRLDDLEKRIREERHDHIESEISRRLRRALEILVRERARAKGAGFKDVVSWAGRPDGLSAELFARFAMDLTVHPEEARRIFLESERRKTRRFTYGNGTALHPEERARAVKSGRKTPSADAWWAAAPSRDREQFVKAWFSEFSGVLVVDRIEFRGRSVRERIVVCH